MIHLKMFESKCLALLIVTVLIFERNQLIIAKVLNCNLFCENDRMIDFKTCTCVEKSLEESERRIRSLDGIASVSELIRGEEFNSSQSSNHRCSNDELWNGSACISSISLCPGGYHWNGRACIVKSYIIQTAALVPSDPGRKCKYAQQYAQHREEERSYNNHLPASVAPTISTSPMCPFGFIWSEKGCVRSSPGCPSGYSYFRNVCHLNSSHSVGKITEITTETAIFEAMPLIDEIQTQYSIKNDKWQQKAYESESEVKYNSKDMPTTEHGIAEMSDDKKFAYDENHQCCSIMSPRICQRIGSNLNEQWKCYHHKHRICGDVCTKPNIIMRPRQFSFTKEKQMLIMPPPPSRLMKLIQKHVHRDTNIGKSLK